MSSPDGAIRGGRAPAPPSARARATLDRRAGVFAALGDPTRLHVVAVLCAGGALSIAELTAGTALTRQGVTKHLEVLADAGLVRDVRVGRERRWQLEPAPLADARRSLDAYAERWDRALEGLKASLER